MLLNFKNKKITDNTTEIEQADFFLLTIRNKKYLKEIPRKINIITIPDLIKEWKLDQIKFVGITGTNGKTTVATTISHILNSLNHLAANQGTSGFFIGSKKITDKKMTTPEILETLFNAKTALEKNAKFFIMEVSSHSIKQQRIQEINFTLKVHTNITSDHLDYHKTITEYQQVKNSFLKDNKTIVVINIDDEFVYKKQKNIITYSWNKNKADYKIKDLNFKTPLVGKFNLYNLTASFIAVQKLLPKISSKEIKKTLIDFKGMAGRMEVISKEPLIIVDFAHTPDGMEKVLSAFNINNKNKNKKISVVFGAGGDRDNSKRSVMGKIADQYAQKIYLTSDNPRGENPKKIIQQILVGIKNKKKVQIFLDRKKALQKALQDLSANEILLVLGKGDETYQEIQGVKIPFDDKKIIKENLKC